jgi:anti-sigma factor RsiW
MTEEPIEPGDDHERLAADVAGYVLGGLTRDETRAFEDHLATCAACRHELEELDPVPVLLDLSVTSTSAPELIAGDSITGEPDPVEPARRHRRGRRAAVVAGAAVSLLVVAAAFLVGFMVARPEDSGYTQAVALHPAASVAAPSARGTVAVRPVDHGTEVRLDVSGLPATAGTWYECLWWSNDGVRSAGTFRVSSGAATQVELTTAAELHRGWRLAILEHAAGRAVPVTVLSTST